MNEKPRSPNYRNLLALLLLLAALFYAMYHEEYLSRGLITWHLWAFGVVSIILCAVLGLYTSSGRFVALISTVFFVEYIKEGIGIDSGLWVYEGKGGQFIFGVCSWVLGALLAYGLATRVLLPWLRGLFSVRSRWPNPLIMLACFGAALALLGGYEPEIDFYIFYGLLAAVCVIASTRMSLMMVLSVVLASWAVGNPAELIGGCLSQGWRFPFNPDYPPAFLVFGCWPLEILTQITLSAILAKEALEPPAPSDAEV